MNLEYPNLYYFLKEIFQNVFHVFWEFNRGKCTQDAMLLPLALAQTFSINNLDSCFCDLTSLDLLLSPYLLHVIQINL